MAKRGARSDRIYPKLADAAIEAGKQKKAMKKADVPSSNFVAAANAFAVAKSKARKTSEAVEKAKTGKGRKR